MTMQTTDAFPPALRRLAGILTGAAAALACGLGSAPLGAADPLDTTDLVAWYDFDDATDSHGSYDLDEINGPVYENGYVTTSDSDGSTLERGDLKNIWGGGYEGDKTLAIRFRGYGSIASGDDLFDAGPRSRVEWHSTINGKLDTYNKVSSAVAPVLGQWHVVIIERDDSSDLMRITVDGVEATATIGRSAYPGELNFGNATDVEISWAALFKRTLTAAERTCLYNNGDELEYADLLSPNAPPVADAGEDATVVDADEDGSETVTLDGTGSSDSDGTIASYSWKEDGSEIATGATPSVTLSVGVHTIELTVADDDGATDTDTVVVEVIAGNVPPDADAGEDIAATDADRDGSETVTLDGSGSSDSDGTVASYLWEDEGSSATWTGASPSATLSEGIHTIELTVTDDDGATDTDTVKVTVSAPGGPQGSDTPQTFTNELTGDGDGDGSRIDLSDTDLVIENREASAIRLSTGGSERLRIGQDGNVLVRAPDSGAAALDVDGTVRSKKVVVDADWADFVFEAGYELPSLSEVEGHIRERGRLPGVPSAAEVARQGVSIGDSQSLLLQKIEEMTLYMIQLKKENEELLRRVRTLESER